MEPQSLTLLVEILDAGNLSEAARRLKMTRANVSYHLNRLQALVEPLDYCVTLNQTSRIGAGLEIRRMTYEHPVYTAEAVRAQSRLAGLATDRTVYAGAYHGWGFHEDGCRSGVEAARHFGVTW